jgi:hypothetical protein
MSAIGLTITGNSALVASGATYCVYCRSSTDHAYVYQIAFPAPLIDQRQVLRDNTWKLEVASISEKFYCYSMTGFMNIARSNG